MNYIEKIRGALARGYCSKENEHKELDAELLEAIVPEVEKLLTEVDRRARVEERGRLAKILDDVTYADGFVGMSEEEWSGAKKMCKITIQDFLTNLTPNQ